MGPANWLKDNKLSVEGTHTVTVEQDNLSYCQDLCNSNHYMEKEPFYILKELYSKRPFEFKELKVL